MSGRKVRRGRFVGSSRILGLTIAAVLAAAVSSLPAGIGNLGRTTTSGTGNTGSRTDLSYNPTKSVTIFPGQAISNVRDLLVAQVNADPNEGFVGASVTDVNDPNSNSFSVTHTGGAELSHMRLCESDANVDNLGVSFGAGQSLANLNKVTTLNADGDFILSVTSLSSGTTTLTFNTTTSPNNTPAGLNASIMSGFIAAGYTVFDIGTSMNFRRPGSSITAMRVSSTDSGVVSFCIDLGPEPVSPAQPLPVSAVPTVGEVGMFLLIVMLTGSALWVLRRDAMNSPQ